MLILLYPTTILLLNNNLNPYFVVLAFTGAPASFPVQDENKGLHQFLEWNEKISERAVNFIRHVLPVGAFIGIHLRNGVDWV